METEKAEVKVPSFTEVMYALSDGTRLMILELAEAEDVHPDKLAKKLGTSRTNVYKHLEILQETGFIEKAQHPDGRVYYHFRDQGRAAYSKWKQTHEEFVKGTFKIEEIPPITRPEPGSATPVAEEPAKPWLSAIEETLNKLSRIVGGINIKRIFVTIEAIIFAIGLWWLITSIIAYVSGKAPPLAVLGGLFVAILTWIIMFLLHALYKRYVA